MKEYYGFMIKQTPDRLKEIDDMVAKGPHNSCVDQTLVDVRGEVFRIVLLTEKHADLKDIKGALPQGDSFKGIRFSNSMRGIGYDVHEIYN